MRLAPLVAVLIVAAYACSSTTGNANAACGNSGAAATVSGTDGQTFAPGTTTIAVGQSVCWQNSGSIAHTVTDNGGAFNSNLSPGQMVVHAYGTKGTFPYHCQIHAGMTGTVTVQ